MSTARKLRRRNALRHGRPYCHRCDLTAKHKPGEFRRQRMNWSSKRQRFECRVCGWAKAQLTPPDDPS